MRWQISDLQSDSNSNGCIASVESGYQPLYKVVLEQLTLAVTVLHV